MNEISKIDAEMKENWKETNEIHERNKRKPKTATTPTPAQNTPGTFMASGDVQPVQTIMALTPESADVRPTAQATQPPKTNSSQSYTQRLYSQYLARNNIPNDTSTVRQPITALTPNSTPQAPVQPQAPKPTPAQTQSRNYRRRMRDFDIPDDMAYDPVRDKDIADGKIFTEERFRTTIKNLQDSPEFAGCSTEQMLIWANQLGWRIKK